MSSGCRDIQYLALLAGADLGGGQGGWMPPPLPFCKFTQGLRSFNIGSLLLCLHFQQSMNEDSKLSFLFIFLQEKYKNDDIKLKIQAIEPTSHGEYLQCEVEFKSIDPNMNLQRLFYSDILAGNGWVSCGFGSTWEGTNRDVRVQEKWIKYN